MTFCSRSFRSESSSTSPLQMTLLEGRVGGVGDGPEVTTLTARFHSGNGSSTIKQKMMDTTGSEETSFMIQHQQHQHQQRSGAYADSRTMTSPQRVPDMAQSSTTAVVGRCGRRQLQPQQQQHQQHQQQQQHELKGWSEVSNVLLQSTSDEAKDQRHSLANDAFNDRNNNNSNNSSSNNSSCNNAPQPGNQMNF